MPKDTDGVKISEAVTFVGPFYFEQESMKAVDIIRCEKRMIESFSNAIFLLDDAACQGTLAEIMYAGSLGKTLHLFYVQHNENEETESELHAVCWYPTQFCQMTKKPVYLKSVSQCWRCCK